MKMWVQLFVATLLTCSSVHAQSATSATNAVEKITRQDGKVFVWQGGKSNLLEKEIVFAGDIKVTSDGLFIVGAGKKRQLQNGESLGLDRTLTTSGGQIVPLVDHIIMRNGKLLIVKDGENAPLSVPFRLPDGSVVMPDGILRTASGAFTRLIDGHMIRLDGAGAIAAKDTATLQDKKVLVFKDGSQFEVKPAQSITMNDGSRVYGNGDVVMRDGKRVQLSEGQIISFEGVALSTR